MSEERLQKYISRCGVASRRKCEELILEGKVKVNGDVITILGTKIDPEKDSVYIEGRLIQPEEKKVYIALNKPVGFVSTVKDEKNRKTILDLVKVEERVYPIGRLDYDSSGLILLTNDGDIYNNVIHPRVEVNKVYEVVIKGHPDSEDIRKFKNGIDIGGYITAPAEFIVLQSFKDTTKARVIIHEGKNRQIRKMCETICHPVITLERVSVGDIHLGKLPPGKWRKLSDCEISYLKNLR